MKHFIYIILMFPIFLLSQESISGKVFEANDKNQEIGLVGANVYWLNTEVGTVTDIDGNFTLSYKPEYSELVISYVGFKTDTLTINATKKIKHWLQPYRQFRCGYCEI